MLAMPSLSGSSGLVKIPTADVAPDGLLTFGFSWIGGARSYLFPPQTNRMYYAIMGILPGVEISIDMLQVIGWEDPEAPGVVYAMHRLSNFKAQLPLPDGWPRLAIGAQDPVSANALARGPIGQTNYGLNTYYAVASQAMGPLSIHLGYADSPSFIRGVFGGVDWDLNGGLNVRLEHDSKQLNLGVFLKPTSWLSLYAARLFPDDWAYGTAINWHL